MVNEKRLIDANALIAEYCDGCSAKAQGCHPFDDPVCGAVELMNDAPTVDAVEVVRCKDCKHIETIENSIPYCTWHHSGCGYDDFCSYGERREGE